MVVTTTCLSSGFVGVARIVPHVLFKWFQRGAETGNQLGFRVIVQQPGVGTDASVCVYFSQCFAASFRPASFASSTFTALGIFGHGLSGTLVVKLS